MAGRRDTNTNASTSNMPNTIQPSGWWRYSGAAAVTASISASAYCTTNILVPLLSKLLLLPKVWRLALNDILSAPHVLVSLFLLQLVVLVYWRCLVTRDCKAAKRATYYEMQAEFAALFVVLFLVQKLGIGSYASDLDIAGITAAQWYIWVVLRSQLGQSPPLFPAIEGRSRFFRVKARLGIALTDTMRTVAMSSAAATLSKIVFSAALLVFRTRLTSSERDSNSTSAPVVLWSLKPLIHPTTLYLSWLIHSAIHATEVVATERFRFCRTVESKGDKVGVLGMDTLIQAMKQETKGVSIGSKQAKRKDKKALDKELAYLDACLLAEKSTYWRGALFTYNKGDYWYHLIQLIHEELKSLERKLIEASTVSQEQKGESKARKPNTRSMTSRDIHQQRAFLTRKNVHLIAESVRDSQVVFTWSLRTITALSKACAREDPLGVSQRHSKKPSLQDILVSTVSLYLLFTSLEMQLAQASGKQSAMISTFHKIVHRILGVNALDGDMETTYTNIWAMTDTLKLAIYSIVKAFTRDLFTLQMENIVETLSKASENTSTMRDDPFSEKLPLFYPLWLSEGMFGHGTPSQHAHVLNQCILHNL